MGVFGRVHALAQKIGWAISTRPAPIAWPGGVISFTFDDFPKSALVTGGGILERYGLRGTYYAALKLAATADVLGPMFDGEDVRAAHDAGHEIACHTYTHLNCRHAARRTIVAEVCKNQAAISALIEGFTPINFAYPFGAVSLAARLTLGARFSSCRGIRPGINCGIGDLADLLATQVYAANFDEFRIRRLIDQNRSLGGWLIFYTHDVAEKPSPFGCKPRQLERIVAYAARSATILPVRDVVAKVIRYSRAYHFYTKISSQPPHGRR
jgi:peptidoglycan/xylan/chitin deacetylase (PgdA/CDA1 family)